MMSALNYYMPIVGLLFVALLLWAIVASTTDYLNPRASYRPVPWQAAANLRTVCYKLRNGTRWIEYEHIATGRRFVLNGKQWRDATTGRYVKQSIVING